MQLTEKQIEDHKAWLQDQKPAYQAYVGVLIADKLTAAESALAEANAKIAKMQMLATPHPSPNLRRFRGRLALEEAAKVCEKVPLTDISEYGSNKWQSAALCRKVCILAIRSLATNPAEPTDAKEKS